MAERKQRARGKSGAARDDAPPSPPDESIIAESIIAGADDQVVASNLSLHELFQQQAREMLDRTDLDEEQKAMVLVSMSCPCCGAGGLSFTAKLKRK
jgi:hypothetical protein